MLNKPVIEDANFRLNEWSFPDDLNLNKFRENIAEFCLKEALDAITSNPPKLIVEEDGSVCLAIITEIFTVLIPIASIDPEVLTSEDQETEKTREALISLADKLKTGL